MRPMTSLRNTDLPVPEPPMMTRFSPSRMVRLMPRRICWSPICLCRLRTEMKGGPAVDMRSGGGDGPDVVEEEGEEEVGDEDGH